LFALNGGRKRSVHTGNGSASRDGLCLSSLAGAIVLAFSFMLTVSLAGCVSNAAIMPKDPLAVLGKGASYYIVFPVKQNLELVKLFAARQKDGATLLQAADRTDIVYAGIFGSDMRLMATGSFPKAAAPVVFPAIKGWKKVSESGIGSWYTSGSANAAIPRQNVVLMTSGAGTGEGMRDMLHNLDVPQMPVASPDFTSFAAIVPPDGRIGMYLSDVQSLTTLLLGPDISLPVQYAEIYAIPQAKAESGDTLRYLVSIHAVLKDSRSSKAMTTLLRLALPRLEVKIDGMDLYISSIEITAEKLVELVGNMYFTGK